MLWRGVLMRRHRVWPDPLMSPPMDQPDFSTLAKYIPGFDFLLNLSRQAAGSVAPGGASGVSGMSPMSHWVAPTFDVEELDKRIQDLRAVHFWLDQNTKALGATIQALEVQKMTLATLKGMNVGLGEMAGAFKLWPGSTDSAAGPAEAPSAAPAPEPAPEPAAAGPTSSRAGPKAEAGRIDPMQWWQSLTEQFQTIAAGAVRDLTTSPLSPSADATQPVPEVGAKSPAAGAKTPPAKTSARRAPAKSATKNASKSAPQAKRTATSPASRPAAPKKRA